MAFLFTVPLRGQQNLHTQNSRAEKAYRKALSLFQQRQYTQAEYSLQDAVRLDPAFLEAWLMLGDVYAEKKDPDLAIEAYRSAIQINPEVFPPALVVLARMLRSRGEYEEALSYYRHYLRLAGEGKLKEEAQMGEASCLFALNALQNPVPFDPMNLGAGVNSEFDEFVNAISSDGEHLYFTVKLPAAEHSPYAGKLVEDFYYSEWGDDQWQFRRPLGEPVNTPGNEGALMISADGRYLFFAGCERPDGFGSCDIYYAIREGKNWSEPRNLGRPVNSGRWDSHPSFASDGRTLYFSSNRGGGKGGADLWMSRVNEDGSWSSPQNLGDQINSAGNEMSPHIHPDGRTLYFASDGHPGMGGLDIFVTRMKDDGSWDTPRNLGYPINTLADELALIVDASGALAYFSSDKLGGSGKYDVYQFPLYAEARPLPVTYMKGQVLDAQTGQFLQARFELIDLESGRTVVESWSDKQKGDFLVCIPSNASYALNVSADGYLFHSEHFFLPPDYTQLHPYKKDIPLQKISVGKSVVMQNVFFDTDQHQLKPESKVELNNLVRLLEENPGMQIEIAGHTDNVGSEAYNLQLSEQRASTVFDFLVANGIAKERLTFKGYGFSAPIADNNTEEGRAQNRRTAFTVTAL
jgi:outer membrane protein OmpA-like peptidoglycan-associated protein